MPQHRFPVDVLIILTRGGRVLLTERAGDIYMAGFWAVPGGKVDAGETVLAAAAREVAEEIGIRLTPADLDFVGVTHHRPPHGDSRIGFAFHAELDDDTEPQNREPAKCARLAWHDPAHLPGPTMPYTREVIRLYQDKQVFSLHDWNSDTGIGMPATPGT